MALCYILFDYSFSNYDKYVQLMKNNNSTYLYKDDNLKIFVQFYIQLSILLLPLNLNQIKY